MAYCQFMWFDHRSQSTQRVANAYSALFTWEKKVRGATAADLYLLCSRLGVPAAGFASSDAGVSGWLGYIPVNDLAQFVPRWCQSGGEVVVTPARVDGIGQVGIFRDPMGGMLGVYQPVSAESDRPKTKSLGHVCWVELLGTGACKSASFYAEVFSWQLSESTGADGRVEYVTAFDKQEAVAGFANFSRSDNAYWLPYVSVHDISAAVSAIKTDVPDLSVISSPEFLSGIGWVAQIEDCTGAKLGLFQRV